MTHTKCTIKMIDPVDGILECPCQGCVNCNLVMANKQTLSPETLIMHIEGHLTYHDLISILPRS